jgi:hypothetical protein
MRWPRSAVLAGLLTGLSAAWDCPADCAPGERLLLYPHGYLQGPIDLNPVFAKDTPFDPPQCPEGEEYDPDQCKCVKKAKFSFTTPVGPSGSCHAKTPALGSIQISEIWATVLNSQTPISPCLKGP